MELHYSDYDFYSYYELDEELQTGITIGFGENDQVINWWGYGDFGGVENFTLVELYQFIIDNIHRCDRGEGKYSNEKLLDELLEFIRGTKGFELDKECDTMLQA